MEIFAAWREEQLLRRSTEHCRVEKFQQIKQQQETPWGLILSLKHKGLYTVSVQGSGLILCFF